MAYVKANQAGIVLFVLLFALLQNPWVLAVLWAVQLVGLLSGGRWNAFVWLAKPFLRTEGRETQALELQRFNNSLAVLFLTLSLLFFSLGWDLAGYLFVAMMFLAASAALLGYCIGCTVYFQYKQLVHKMKHV